ncbi:hypothetical protein HT136_11995 [Novosphingobium profundi]|uniref:hypothetical protein n=1 Tax=Novosphingobium profundi TaxID=1774954 RepID=UPI001BDA9DBE|nr:hypothetical protein [Novosphingobium profundi]MBT0669086.1 hypothetical protein [Novosphingobium profundi]
MQASIPGQPCAVQEEAFAFVFPPGMRPDLERARAIFEEGGQEGLIASLSHVPDPSEGWMEILSSGLTFDVRGLGPAPAQVLATTAHAYGFASGAAAAAWQDGEAITLGPAGHIAAGAGLAPVIRTMAGLAANIALALPVSAVVWPPARSAMEPAYFARIVLNWLGGGVFPALGLTSLATGPDGSVASSGLSFFTGWEMQLEAGRSADPAADFKLALRVVDYLVANGVPREDTGITIGSENLVLEPSRQGRRLWVWRSQ